MEFNLGYDPSYTGPGDAFDMTGTISPDTITHGSNGPNSFTASWDVPDGDYWAAARVTDFNWRRRCLHVVDRAGSLLSIGLDAHLGPRQL